MKMKRYFAPDIRLAIRKVREDQGSDAVILSNRQVDGGVEIIAALDYDDALIHEAIGNPDTYNQSDVADVRSGVDTTVSHNVDKPIIKQAPDHPAQGIKNDAALGGLQRELKSLRNIMEAPLMQLAWGEAAQSQPLYAGLLKRLMTLGLDSRLCEQIANKVVQGSNRMDRGWINALRLLLGVIPVSNNSILSNGGVVALVGPTGVGKTTTIAKLAARFALQHGRRNVALITTDSYRIGAHEQLRAYGKIMGVPVQVAGDGDELRNIIDHNGSKKLTLIDTAGASQRDVRLSRQLATLKIKGQDIKNYLVLSATAEAGLQEEVIRSFGKHGLNGCILTKLDEAVSLGGVLSVLIQSKLPVAYVGNGQRVPDDLHPARRKGLVRSAVKLMQKTRKTPSEESLAYEFGGMVANAHV